jgi:hypothetical protein
MVGNEYVLLCTDVNTLFIRLQAMQKMQSAAGGRGRGTNGMPTPAQIQAMQVRKYFPPM